MAYLVACGAPPTRDLPQFIELLQADGWDVCVVPTPSALGWLDVPAAERLTGLAITAQDRKPDTAKRLPKPEMLIVAPATFNSINKWAAGISDNSAMGVLNEALGSGIPVVASPYAKPELASHPAFQRSLDSLAAYGVHLTSTEALRPSDPSEPFYWQAVLDLVREHTPQ